MPYSLYGPDAITGHSKRFSSSDLGNLKSLVARVGKSVTVLSLCQDAININSVLVLFRASCLLLENCEHFLSLRLNLSDYCEYCYSRM